jgi:hypothetical protein
VGAVCAVTTSAATAYRVARSNVYDEAQAFVYTVLAPANRAVSFTVAASRDVRFPLPSTAYRPNRTNVGVAPAAVPEATVTPDVTVRLEGDVKYVANSDPLVNVRAVADVA